MTAVAGRRRAFALAGAVLGVAVVVVVLLVSAGGGGSAAPRRGAAERSPGALRALTPAAAPAATPGVAPPARSTATTAAGLTRFHDGTLGFSITYPSSWRRLSSGDPQVPLLASSPGGAEALLVRTTHLGLTVGAVTMGELPKLLPLTNRLVHADPGVHLLLPAAEVRLGGLPGYAYVYTEAGSARGARIAHVHYFLFSGPALIALVFQVSNASRLTAVSPVIERIARTFTAAAPAAPAVSAR
jgi:hypothetical protein